MPEYPDGVYVCYRLNIRENKKKKKGKTRSVTKAIRETVVFRILAA